MSSFSARGSIFVTLSSTLWSALTTQLQVRSESLHRRIVWRQQLEEERNGK
jgi:hypothetical protein